MTIVDSLGASSTGSPERPSDLRVAILLCAGLSDAGLDLDEVSEVLGARLPGVATRVVERLCECPEAAVDVMREAGANRAVLASCRRRLPEAELHARARRNETGPYDIELVRVPHARTASIAATVIEARVARLALAPRGEPSRVGVTSHGLSRRALFKLSPAITVQPVATVEGGACVGFTRCGLCASACPTSAIAARDGKAHVSSAACETCGRCVGVCPTGAIHIAGTTTRQVEAQLTTLLDQHGSVGVTFACARSVAALDEEATIDDWSVVELPTLALVTPGWTLQTLLAGAAAVRLAPCEGECCASWREGGENLDLCRKILPEEIAGRVLAAGPGAAPQVPSQSARRFAAPAQLVLTEPEATAAALRALVPGLRIEHPAMPLGLVRVEDGCTVCGACATACPTSALLLEEDDERTSLFHDPRRCTGCGLCSRACPESVLSVRRGVDTARLDAGPRRLALARRGRCRLCHAPLPPQPVLSRNRRILAAQQPLVALADEDLCASCAQRR